MNFLAAFDVAVANGIVQWHSLSVDPGQTAQALGYFLVCVAWAGACAAALSRGLSVRLLARNIAFIATVLAVVGLFGVVAHAMARRRYELGVRIALGAQWRDVLGLALRQGLVIGLGGTAAGLGLALAASRFLQPLLFEVSAKDLVTLGIAAGAVLLPALLASLASAYRVRGMNPAAVLRVE